jgi:RNA polymerase sigma factor (sigma-70 family)
MTNELYELIQKIQNNDNVSFMEIIERFMPLIKKYAKKLNYDGADTDLIISFIKLIKNLLISQNKLLQEDQEIISYISVSIKNEYIRLSQKYSKTYKNEVPFQENLINNTLCYDDNNDFIMEDLLAHLPELQRKVLVGIYLSNLKQVEIAKSLNISRQAVNKTKKNALKSLKQYLDW